MFDKSTALFPIKEQYIFLSHCGISPLYTGALRKVIEVAERQNKTGSLLFMEYDNILNTLRTSAASLLNTSPDNLAFVKNTSEGINLIANGYPFHKGDQVLSYVHEYPANHYPWKLQEQRGVELVLLSDHDSTGLAPQGAPSGWSMSELERKVTKRTKIIALSHVQFASGFLADMMQLSDFCRAHGIDLVLDAAQSLGCIPLRPEELNISAVVASGWKWLMGPIGTGLMYTSAQFRQKLDHVMVGTEVMKQGPDYLDHTWDPHDTAKRFEFSTSPIALAAALDTCIQEIPLRYGVENIQAEIQRLQTIFLELIDRKRFTPLLLPEVHRSGILALVCKDDPEAIAQEALKKGGVICTGRGGYLRFAPHFYTTDEEVERAAHCLNTAAV